jgi:hypothetical protein
MKRSIELGRNKMRRPMRTAGKVPLRTRRRMPLSLSPVKAFSRGMLQRCSYWVKTGSDDIDEA